MRLKGTPESSARFGGEPVYRSESDEGRLMRLVVVKSVCKEEPRVNGMWGEGEGCWLSRKRGWEGNTPYVLLGSKQRRGFV